MSNILEKVYEILKYLIEGLLDIIYPEKGICFICDNIDETIGDKYICEDCYGKIRFTNDKGCIICGKKVYGNFITCEDCLDDKRYFTKVYAPTKYSKVIKDAIYKYKYKNNAYMYKLFGRILKDYLEDIKLKDFDLIIPVPLHKSKLRSRGFNQSALISKYLSKTINVEVDIKNLIRSKKTLIQNKLSKYERIENIKDAFVVNNPERINNKSILLIDDIYTTGSTVNECSRTLLKNGASEVNVLTIAKVVNK